LNFDEYDKKNGSTPRAQWRSNGNTLRKKKAGKSGL
jgi:hypothetical protein